MIKVMPIAMSKAYSAQNVKEKTNVTTPEMSNTNNSLTNVKSNYAPSFGSGKDNAIAAALTFLGSQNYGSKDKNEHISLVTALPEDKKLKGAYYDSFSDDLAIMIGAEKDVLLTIKKGVDSRILAHNFADRVNNGKYDGMGMFRNYTDVIYIDDPVAAAYKENIRMANEGMIKTGTLDKSYFKADIIDILDKIELDSSRAKIVVIDNFEQVAAAARKSLIQSGLMPNNPKAIVDIAGFLENRYPDINIIGILPNEMFDNEQEKNPLSAITGKGPAQEFMSFPRLELKGLNTAQTKEFFKKNPSYYQSILNEQILSNLKMGDKALSNLIEKSAMKMDIALPTAAAIALKRLSIAKVNESPVNLDKETIITSKNVDDFFYRHSLVMEEFKPETGQFQLAENIKTKLSDVGGISSIKQDIQDDLIAYLKNPDQFIQERGVAPKGVLLEGPPGTGKTLLARAIAGETNTPFISASGSEFVEMYVGVGAKRVRELFSAARSAAENSPNHTAIVFIDEFDALARARSSSGGGGAREAEQTLNQLLTEMDGFNNKESKTKIVVIAATNRKDMLDKAAIRPGRFDDVFTVGNPRTNADRLEVMKIHAKNLKFESEAEKNKILEETAKLTSGMSGAELAGVMNRAKRIVAKREGNKFVTYNDMVEGYLQTIAGPVQKNADERPIEDIIETVRHEGGHATVIDTLAPLLGDKVSFITLDQRGNFLGAVFRKPSEMSPNVRSVILSAAVGYAGGMAEPEFAENGRSAGVSQDVSQATRLFRKAITEWGQGVFTPPITMVPNNHENDAQANAFYDTMRSVNEKNIAKDVALFSATAGAIAAMVNKFHDGFLNEYVESFKANAGKGGNSLSGEQFSKLRHDWVVRNGKEKEEKRMIAKINRMLENVVNKNTNIFQKILKKAHKTL